MGRKRFGLVDPTGTRSVESDSVGKLRNLQKKKKYRDWSIES